MKFAFVFQTAEPPRQQLSLCNLGQHMREFVLHELKLRNRLIELRAAFRVFDRAFITCHGGADAAPRNPVPGLIEAHQRRFQSRRLRKQIRFRHKYIIEDQI